jgi:hypothetical protein
LHAAGYDITTCGDEPLLHHLNTVELKEVGRNAFSYSKSCRVYAGAHDPAYCEKYFAVSHHAARVLSSPEISRWKRKARLAQLKFHLARSAQASLAAYTDYHEAMSEIGWRTIKPGSLDFTAPLRVDPSGRTVVSVDSLHHLFPIEQHNGVMFRWSPPIAEHELHFAVVGAYEVHLDTGALRGHCAELALTALWNGVDIGPCVASPDGRTITFRVDVEREGIGILTTCVEPLAVDRQTGEQRELGIPICRISVQRKSSVHATSSGAIDLP